VSSAGQHSASFVGRFPTLFALCRFGEESLMPSPHDVAFHRGHRLAERIGQRGGYVPPTRRAEEHRPAFRRTIKWRTGSEGRISTLKRGYGWDRTRIDGTEGTVSGPGMAS
jgi:hypothetical protein